MSKPTFRRVFAYIIDVLIVAIISAALATLPFFKKYYTKYEENSNRYVELLNEASQSPEKMNQLLNDDNIKDITYDVSKSGVFISIINLVISVLYFVVFQYITNGKTGGKALFKIEVAPINDKKVRLSHIIKRSLIVNRLIFSLLSILLILCLSKSSYINYSPYLEIVDLGIMLLTFGMIIYNDNGQGLHDKFAHTQVILSEEREYFYKNNKKVKEAKIVKDNK